jgi:hypothetical protein
LTSSLVSSFLPTMKDSFAAARVGFRISRMITALIVFGERTEAASKR